MAGIRLQAVRICPSCPSLTHPSLASGSMLRSKVIPFSGDFPLGSRLPGAPLLVVALS